LSRQALGVLFEHPTWFEGLFQELTRAGVAHERWRADSLAWEAGGGDLPALFLSRMSASAAWRGHANAQQAVLVFLRHLEAERVEVINGAAAYELEISKLRQIEILRACGARSPRTCAVNHIEALPRIAESLAYPVFWKPDCGGAGSGVQRFDSRGALLAAAAGLDFGSTHIGIVQEAVHAREPATFRVEVLDGQVLYGLRILRQGEGYNLCPADGCESRAKPRFEAWKVPEAVATQVVHMARRARLDIGGFEFIEDMKTGEPVFIDINPLSNFVSGAKDLLGFCPTLRLVDYLRRRLAAAR
jgi:glutathione synthase/RimK-type ligase-like ATP-grasp enzyme